MQPMSTDPSGHAASPLSPASPDWARAGPPPASLPLGVCEQWVTGRLYKGPRNPRSPRTLTEGT